MFGGLWRPVCGLLVCWRGRCAFRVFCLELECLWEMGLELPLETLYLEGLGLFPRLKRLFFRSGDRLRSVSFICL